ADVVLVAHPTLDQLTQVQARLGWLREALGGRLWLALCGPGPYRAAEIARDLRVQVAGELPDDGKGAGVLSGRLVGRGWQRLRLTARQMPLDPPVEQRVARAVRDWFTGLGPLTPLLADKRNTNIFINGNRVLVKRTDGSKDRLPAITSSDDELIDLVRDIATR